MHRTALSRRPRIAAEFSESAQAQDEVSLKIGTLLGKHLDSVFLDLSPSMPSSGTAFGEQRSIAPVSESCHSDAFRLFSESPPGTVVVLTQYEAGLDRDESHGEEQAIGSQRRLSSGAKHRNGRRTRRRKNADGEVTDSEREDSAKRPRIVYPSSANVLKRTKPAASASRFEVEARKLGEKEAASSSSEDEAEQMRFASVVVNMTASDISAT